MVWRLVNTAKPTAPIRHGMNATTANMTGYLKTILQDVPNG